MGKEYWEYLILLGKCIPSYIYLCLLLLFVIGVVLIISIRGLKEGWRIMTRWVLVEYLVLIFCSTNYYRATNEYRKYNIKPFSSYEKCFQEGYFQLDPEIALNILVFLPIGVLIGLSCKGINLWKTVLLGAGVSILIEILQLTFKRGLSEFDDIFHNTIGCVVGYGIYSLFVKTCRLIKTEKR